MTVTATPRDPAHGYPCSGMRPSYSLWRQATCRVGVFFVASYFLLTLDAHNGARANPTGGTVVDGSAYIENTSPTRLDVFQASDRAIIDWRSFSIDAHEHTHFQQPSSTAMALNRVTGGDPSSIFGRLSATGQILLINPNGVLFGPGSRIDVAGLVATTTDIHNSDFMAGRLNFTAPSPVNAGVINQGQITVQEGGLVALVAPWVENTGVITARLGRVSLASGHQFALDLYGDQLVQLGVDEHMLGELTEVAGNRPDALIKNGGVIAADGGMVQLSVASVQSALDRVINMDGIVQAQTIEELEGQIVLNGGPSGTVTVAGRLDASGLDRGEMGGKVVILGERVGLFADATGTGAVVDSSGDAGGGTILVGGNYQGRGPERNASSTAVEERAVLKADAVSVGDGGTVIVWADDVTRFGGSISARGGRDGGDGGFVETSGKEHLEIFGGRVDAGAPLGRAGTWLLDPRDVDIRNVASSGGAFDSDNPNTFTPTSDSAVADRNTIETSLNAGTNVTITTGATGTQNGDITVTDSISKTGGASATLALNAAGAITINDSISGGGNQLSLSLTAGGGNITQSASGVLSIDGTTTLSASGADITLNQANDFNTVTIASADNVTLVDANGIDLGASTIDANLSVTAGGQITDSGALAVTGTTTLSAAGNNIVLNTAGNNFTGAVSIDAGNDVTLVDSSALNLGNSTVSGNLTVTANGAITDSGDVVVGGMTTLAAGAGNNITLNGVNNNFTTVQVTSGNNVTFRDVNGLDIGASTISGTLTVTANGSVTDSGALAVTGTTTVAAGAGNDVTLDTGTNDFSTVTVTSGNNVTVVDTNAVNIGASTVSGSLNVTSGGAVDLAASTVGGNLGVTANGAVTDSGALAVTGTTTVAAGAANDITLDTTTNDFSTVAITSGNNVTLVDTNGIDLGASTISGNLAVTANGTITTSGVLSVTGSRSLVNLSAPSGGSSSSTITSSQTNQAVTNAQRALGPFFEDQQFDGALVLSDTAARGTDGTQLALTSSRQTPARMFRQPRRMGLSSSETQAYGTLFQFLKSLWSDMFGDSDEKDDDEQREGESGQSTELLDHRDEMRQSLLLAQSSGLAFFPINH